MDRPPGALARLAPSEIDRAASLLARAFHNDPAVAFLFPDPEHRARVTPALWRGVTNYARLYGEVWTAPDLTGIACWLPPGQTHKTLPRLLAARMGRLIFLMNWVELRGILANDRLTEALHVRHAPGLHWYLFAIAVEPACQGQGAGSALLRPVLDRAATGGLPVYLETHNPRNVAFYKKHRFAVAGTGYVPGSRVTVFSMVRPGD